MASILMRTFVATPKHIERGWYVIDAGDQVLGRVATMAAKLLQEVKHRAGADVLVVNLKRCADLAARRRESHGANHAQPIVAIPGALHWRFTTRGPRTAHHAGPTYGGSPAASGSQFHR